MLEDRDLQYFVILEWMDAGLQGRRHDFLNKIKRTVLALKDADETSVSCQLVFSSCRGNSGL